MAATCLPSNLKNPGLDLAVIPQFSNENRSTTHLDEVIQGHHMTAKSFHDKLVAGGKEKRRQFYVLK